METKGEENIKDNTEEVINNCFPFDFERFDFLEKCLKQTKEDFGLKTNEIQITCFDVNQNLFVFGSNCGIIYCFKRHVFNDQQLFKYRLFSSPINSIKLITDELLSFVTETAVYVWNRLSRKFLYGWKCPTKSAITCLQTYMSINDQKLFIISGDSDGCVRFHDLIGCQQNPIYSDFGFKIIQIEFIDSRTLLISSSLKTVIIEIDFSDLNKQKTITVGKNERKTYGKYGAVYSHKTGLIYGSRPSLHLIKADLNGNVIETIRINHIKESECPQNLEQLVSKPITGKAIYKLGVLQLFCGDQYIISTNDSNLLIVRTDGLFCMKERIDKMIDIKISVANSNDAFLLLQSKHIIRIRNNQMMTSCSDLEVSSDYEKSTESEGMSTTDKSSNESLFNLMKGPVILNPISFIDEELKKVFDFNAIQTKLTKKYNQLSTSIISTIDPKTVPNSDKNVFVEQDFGRTQTDDIDNNSPTKEVSEVISPLVVTRKGKRKVRHNSSDSLMTINSTTDSVNSNEDVYTNAVTQSLDTKHLKNSETSNQISETNGQNEDNRLEMILSAYREANNIVDQIQTSEENFLFEDKELTKKIEMSLSLSETNVSPNYYEMKSDSNDMISESTQISNIKTEPKNNELDQNSIERQNSVKQLNPKWEQMIRLFESKQNNNYIFSSFCGNGYNSSTEMGLIWFRLKEHNSLVYYPSFDSLRLSKGLAQDITAANNQLFVLNDSGIIFRREGMDATKPVGTKWTQMKGPNKSKFKLTSISLNWKDSILWCCDANGETYVNKIKSKQWNLITDFSSHSIEMRKVCVSPIDSTIVWGLDRSGKVFVRSFKSGDNQNDFCGDEWLLMDGILATDIVVCCDNSVLIAVRDNQLFRRSAKISPNDKINEWKPVISPDITDDDSFAYLSGITQSLIID